MQSKIRWLKIFYISLARPHSHFAPTGMQTDLKRSQALDTAPGSGGDGRREESRQKEGKGVGVFRLRPLTLENKIKTVGS